MNLSEMSWGVLALTSLELVAWHVGSNFSDSKKIEKLWSMSLNIYEVSPNAHDPRESSSIKFPGELVCLFGFKA